MHVESKHFIKASFYLLIITSLVFLHAETPGNDFPDSYQVRAQLFSTLIGAPKEAALGFAARSYPTSYGQVWVDTRDAGSSFVVEFKNLRANSGPDQVSLRGSMVVVRSASTGFMLEARLFIADDPGSYVRLYPQGKGTRADVVVYNAVVKKGLYLENLMYQIIIRPFGEIVALTRRSFDWSTVLGPSASAATAASVTDQASQLLGSQIAHIGIKATSAKAIDTNEMLASAPAFQRNQDAVQSDGLNPAGIASIIFNSQSVDGLILDLAKVGSQDSEELAGANLAQICSISNLDQTTAYAAFPAYSAVRGGIDIEAARALIWQDSLSHSSALYALMGDDLRVVAVPVTAKGLQLDFFVPEQQISFADLASGNRKVRVVRIPIGDAGQ